MLSEYLRQRKHAAARPQRLSLAAGTASTEGGSVNRGDSANTAISASTPSTHSPAIVSPLRPDACQVMEAKV